MDSSCSWGLGDNEGEGLQQSTGSAWIQVVLTGLYAHCPSQKFFLVSSKLPFLFPAARKRPATLPSLGRTISLPLSQTLPIRHHLLQTKSEIKLKGKLIKMFSWTEEHLASPEEPCHPRLPLRVQLQPALKMFFFHFSFPLSLSSFLPKIVLAHLLCARLWVLWTSFFACGFLFPHAACAPNMLGSVSLCAVKRPGLRLYPFGILDNADSVYLSDDIPRKSLRSNDFRSSVRSRNWAALGVPTARLQYNELCGLGVSFCSLNFKLLLFVEWIVWIRWFLRACLVLKLYEGVKHGGMGHVWHICESESIYVNGCE